MSDALVQALMAEQKRYQQNNIFDQGGNILSSYGNSILASNEGNPQDNITAALISGLAGGFSRAYAQKANRDFAGELAQNLRGLSKDYYQTGNMQGFYDSPYQSVREIAPALEFSRDQVMFDNAQKMALERQKRTLDFQYDLAGKGINVGQGEGGALTFSPNVDYAKAQAELERPKLELRNELNPLSAGLDPNLAEIARKKINNQPLTQEEELSLLQAPLRAQNEIRQQAQARASQTFGDKETFKLEDSYRKEFNALPQVKEFQAASKGFESMLAAAKRNNPMADQELARGAVQASEPGLAVREGEYKAIENAEGILPATKQAIQKALLGESGLTPNQRQEIVQWAARRYSGHSTQYDSAKSAYGNKLSQIGGNPSSIEILPSNYPKVVVDPRDGTSYRIVDTPQGPRKVMLGK
jgi:hypothetical protein